MKKMSTFTAIAILSISTLCLASTIHIPGNYSTIQAGINAAVDGDIVLVASGTYMENIDFKGKKITVVSEAGPEDTVIDGGNPIDPQKASVVTFRNNENIKSVLRGFTITNGTGTLRSSSSSYCGAGIYCQSADPLLENNIIRNNRTRSPGYKGRGGGMFIYGSVDPRLVDCVFMENSCIHAYGCYGGGLYSESTFYMCRPKLTGCVFIRNFAGSRGGGIYLRSGGVNLTDCTFVENTSPDPGGGVSSWKGTIKMDNSTFIGNRSDHRGGGIFNIFAKTEAKHCTFLANSADRDGGGIATRKGQLIMTNCVFARNEVDSHFGGGISHEIGPLFLTGCTIAFNAAPDQGGGVYISNEDTTSYVHRITNSIIWSNSAQEGAGIWVGATTPNSQCVLTITHSDLSGGPAAICIGPNGGAHWGDGMIDCDPFFVDAANNDYHLTYTSPCRNAGDNTAQYVIQKDYEEDPRISDNIVDMGADEFHNHFYCTGDSTPGGSIEGKLIGLPDTWPVGLFIGSGVIDPPIQHVWGKLFLEAPWMLYPLLPIPADGVLRMPVTLPSLPAPYEIPMQALIGWELSNLFVLEVK